MKLASIVCLAATLWAVRAGAEPPAAEWLARGFKRLEAKDQAGAFDAFSRALGAFLDC